MSADHAADLLRRTRGGPTPAPLAAAPSLGLTHMLVAVPDADVGPMRVEVERLRARVGELEAREAARLTTEERLIVAEKLAARYDDVDFNIVTKAIATYERWLVVAQQDKAVGAPPVRER